MLLEAQLTADVQELLEKAESTDTSGEVDDTRLPEKGSRRNKLKPKMQEAREELGSRDPRSPVRKLFC